MVVKIINFNYFFINYEINKSLIYECIAWVPTVFDATQYLGIDLIRRSVITAIGKK